WACSDILLTAQNLFRRRVAYTPICLRCRTELAAIREGLQTMFAYEYTSFIMASNSQKTVSMLKGM
ncbi:hypothetical protein GBA52_015282, partial [Prunus armeniaca]